MMKRELSVYRETLAVFFAVYCEPPRGLGRQKEMTIMRPDTLRSFRRLARALALALPLAALAAGGDTDSAWKKAGADEGLRQAFERAVRPPAGRDAGNPLLAAPAWTQQQELNDPQGQELGFGASVSVRGDTAVIGDDMTTVDLLNSNQGGAYVFVLSGGVWTQQQLLIASDGVSGDYFGYSVSVSGDTAVIGAPVRTINSASAQGAAYVFMRSGGVWTQQQELVASDGTANENFGWSVSVDGDTAVIGTVYPGAAYVFVRSGEVWTQQQELTPSDGAMDAFGYPVSLSGGTVVIGAQGKAVNSRAYQGAAYVFVQSGGKWIQQQELTASDGAANDYFGSSASVSGDTAVIGAYDHNLDRGAAYVFVRNGATWSQQQELTAPDGVAGTCSNPCIEVMGGDRLGFSVSVSGDTAVIGAIGHNFSQGAAYVSCRATECGPSSRS